jgi:hypothetical protein
MWIMSCDVSDWSWTKLRVMGERLPSGSPFVKLLPTVQPVQLDAVGLTSSSTPDSTISSDNLSSHVLTIKGADPGTSRFTPSTLAWSAHSRARPALAS